MLLLQFVVLRIRFPRTWRCRLPTRSVPFPDHDSRRFPRTHARTHVVRHRTMHARVSSSFRSTPGLTDVVLGQSSSWLRVFLVSCETTCCVSRGRASLSTTTTVTNGFLSTCCVHVVAMDVSRVRSCLVQPCFGATWSDVFRGA